MLVKRLIYYHRFLLSIAHWGQTRCVYTVLDEVIHYRLCTLERQLLVGCIIAHHIRMRCHLNGDIRIIIQQFHQSLHTILGVGGELPTTKLEEDIAHLHRFGYWRQDKILLVGITIVEPRGGELLLLVEVAARGSQHNIARVLAQFQTIRTIAANLRLDIGAIIAHQTDCGVAEVLAVVVQHLTLHDKLHLGQVERIDLVISALLSAIG